MSTHKISSTLLFTLIVTSISHAQDSPQDFLNAHNKVRSELGVPPVTWDDQVAAYAQNYAQKRSGDCNLIHSQGPYGENIAWGYPDLSVEDAFKYWVDDEKPFYDYGSNTCNSGKFCLHYTQIVWRNTQKIGCGKVHCGNGKAFISCNYQPRGNYMGQKPY